MVFAAPNRRYRLSNYSYSNQYKFIVASKSRDNIVTVATSNKQHRQPRSQGSIHGKARDVPLHCAGFGAHSEWLLAAAVALGPALSSYWQLLWLWGLLQVATDSAVALVPTLCGFW
jgi:hypothetical protein